MKAKSTFLAWNALPSPTWVPGRPNDDGPGLPMAAHGGNISPVRRIIRGLPLMTQSAEAGAATTGHPTGVASLVGARS
jgi:hypothetical protein